VLSFYDELAMGDFEMGDSQVWANQITKPVEFLYLPMGEPFF
jgi:hypothetical protein